MPFSAQALMPVFQSQVFSLWHYRSADTRDEITTDGYFNAARNSLRAGDVMIVEASDSLAFLPVRSNGLVGAGLSLDGAVAPIAVTRTVSKSFQFVQSASAVVTSIILAPLLASFIAGSSIPVQAQVLGPINQVSVAVRDASGQVVPPVLQVDVTQGWVTANLPAPPVGEGYRVLVEDAGGSGISAVSQPFDVLPDLNRLLTEDGRTLVQENGFLLSRE